MRAAISCMPWKRFLLSESTFARAARLMLDLAVAENETWGNNATGQFKSLFPVFLADTTAGPNLRLQVIDDELARNDARRLAIVADALLRGTELDSFTRTVGAETHGSRPALEPWRPKIWKDVFDYVRACAQRLTTVALRTDDVGAYARKIFGHHLRALVRHGQIDFVEEQVGRVIALHSYWPEALSSLGDVLQFDRDDLEAGVEDRVRGLIEKLKPDQIEDRMRFLVTEMPWDYPEDEHLELDDREKRQTEAVEGLATEFLRSEELAEFLPQLSRGNQRKAFEFGRGIGRLADEPLAWRQPIMSAYDAVPPRERNIGVLAGYFAGLAPRDPKAVEEFKEQAVYSGSFAITLPLLCSYLGITENDVELVCQALKSGTIPAHVMMNWVYGGVLGRLSSNAVAPLFDQS